MGQVEALAVNAWNGLDVRPRHSLPSTRRPLDTPRRLTNVQIDAYGHLHYPPASARLVHTFPDDVHHTRFVNGPRALLVQLKDGRVYAVPISTTSTTFPSSANPSLLTTLAAAGFPIWSNSVAGAVLWGYASRGGAVLDGRTFRLTSGSPFDNEDISNDDPFEGAVSYSAIYKGRRFIVSRGRIVRFSELNEFETFLPDSTFTLGGDNEGGDYASFPGAVQGMATWEDVLLFFAENSVWILTGSGPDTYQLRQAMTSVGNSQPFALARMDQGVMTYAGRNIEDHGVYIFTGNTATKVSEQVDPLLFTAAGLSLFSTVAYGQYVLCKPQASANALQVFLYDHRRQIWSTFDGWKHASAELTSVGVFLSDGPNLYVNESRVFPRAPGRTGRITLGWEDEGNTAGHVRFLAVKIAGRKVGTGTPTITVTGRVPGVPGSVTSEPQELTTSTFDNVIVPLNLRGKAIELDITITPTSDTDGVTIESLQVVHSRKGEKVSRG